MSVFDKHHDALEVHETMMGPARGRLAVALDLLTDSLALVGQHGVYCRSDRFPGQPKMDIALVTLTSSLSSYWTGYELDRAGWSPRTLSFALGVSFSAPGLLWLLFLSRWHAPAHEAVATTTMPPAEEEVLEGRVG